MQRLRNLVIAGAVTTLAITALGAPAAAGSHKTKLAIVNGSPGKKLDVCVNGKEIKSGLRYGKVIFKTTRTPKAKVKFFQRDRRKCGGKLLAKKVVGLADATVVFTRRKPKKVVVFDNAFLATPMSATAARVSYGHAADIGPVQFGFDSEIVEPFFFGPSAVDPFFKGDQGAWSNSSSLQIVWVTFVHKVSPAVELLPPFARYLPRQRRWEQILVGTNDANARLVFIDRPGIPA